MGEAELDLDVNGPERLARINRETVGPLAREGEGEGEGGGVLAREASGLVDVLGSRPLLKTVVVDVQKN